MCWAGLGKRIKICLSLFSALGGFGFPQHKPKVAKMWGEARAGAAPCSALVSPSDLLQLCTKDFAGLCLQTGLLLL